MEVFVDLHEDLGCRIVPIQHLVKWPPGATNVDTVYTRRFSQIVSCNIVTRIIMPF